ncbi:MAG: DNA repair protein RecO [Christensenellales bacterium]|jgi:DNA repair protein RecO (recombination protein O)
MAQITTKAIVLRSLAYQDNHRILTLFSGEHGRLSAVAHGALSQRSKLRSASALFACGEYVLSSKGGRTSVRSFSPDANYFAGMSDFDITVHASYLCALCEAVIQPGQSLPGLFALLMEALSHLSYGEADPINTFDRYLLLMLDDLGFAPQIDTCASCGADRGVPKFSAARGGLCCHRCAPEAQDISRELLRFLRAARERQELSSLNESSAKALRKILTDYCHFCIDRKLKAAELFGL